jgi:hypothetical protein
MPRVLFLIVILMAMPRVAESDAGPPSVTVNAGAVLPMFLLYEKPGPWVGTSLAWSMRDRVELVASADTGVLVAIGATRFLVSLALGARISPSRCVPLWVQLGVGVTGFVERIGVVLPERTLRAIDRGIALTGDLAIGVRVTPRWEIVVAYDQQLVSSEPGGFARPGGSSHETIPFIATATVSIGRQL